MAIANAPASHAAQAYLRRSSRVLAAACLCALLLVPPGAAASDPLAIDHELDSLPVPQGGITEIHGLVRTGVVGGDYDGLPPQSAAFGPEFGFSVATEGDWLVVGAPGTVTDSATYGVAEHGAVFVFRRGPGGWILHQRLLRDIGFGGPRCGHSVAMSLPHLAVGCPERAQTADGPPGGGVTMWRLNAASQQFAFNILIESTTSALPLRCGAALALTRNYLATGCPAWQNNQGRASVRKRNAVTDSYAQTTAELFVSGPDLDTRGTGMAVAMYEPAGLEAPLFNVRLAVGAPDTVYAGSGSPRGTVHLYHRDLDLPEWSPNTILRLSNLGAAGNTFAGFGAALAMSRNQLVVGAPNNRYGVIQTVPGPGTVHRYELSTVGGWQAQETGGPGNVPNGMHAGMRFGEAVAIGHDRFVAIAAPQTDGIYSAGQTASGVGLVELRRTGSGDWSVFNYYGELRPAPLSAITRNNGRFGQGMAFEIPLQRLMVGYPRSGSTIFIPGQPSRPRGSVWIHEPDRLFDDGFE